MKLGVTLSSAAHVAILSWGLWSFSSPAPLMVEDVEAIAVDVVPIEDVTQSIEGDKQAELSETPAPVPTQRPQTEPDAQNVGDSSSDVKTERDAEASDNPVDVARNETPPPTPIPAPKPEIVPEAEPVTEDIPAPTNEVAALNEPKVDVAEPAPSTDAPQEETGEQFASLSNVQAVPQRRPQIEKPQKAETTERKKAEEPAKTATATEKKSDDPIGDITKALQSKEDPSSGGAKRSTETASLGTSKPSSTGKLSVSELDALKAQLATCWSVPAGAAGADELRAEIEFDLDRNLKLVGRPRVLESSGNTTFDRSAVRAIQLCERRGFQLPSGKHEIWSQVQVNFSPRDMF